MNVPSEAMVTLPPADVATVPPFADTPPNGRSLVMMAPATPTNGVAGLPVAPPVRTNCVLSTMLLYESPVTTGATDSVYVAPVPLHVFVSVAFTVIGKVPVCVGVPERTPAVESDIPVGSVPLAIVNVAEPRMPVAVNVWLKAVLNVAAVTPGLVTETVWQTITSVYVAPVPAQVFVSVAVTVIGKLPIWVVLPASCPVARLMRLLLGT